MPNRRIAVFAATGAILASTSAYANAQAQRPAAAAPAAVQPLSRAEVNQQLDAQFKTLDANKDGKLTKAEIQAVIVQRAAEAEALLSKRQKDEFAKLDTNKDGNLSLAEYQAGATVKAREDAADIRMNQLDSNKDGTVSVAEFRAATMNQFEQLDKNKDGILSAQERSVRR